MGGRSDMLNQGDLERAILRDILSGSADAEQSQRPHLNVADVPPVSTITGSDITFLVDGLILEGGITMLTGPPGCGKTTLAAALAGHVACGAPFAGRAVQQRAVLILDRENPISVVQERLYRLGVNDGAKPFGGGAVGFRMRLLAPQRR
jgi:stage III sporulation protein SpoIIIAA